MRINVEIKCPLRTKKMVTPKPPGTIFSRPLCAKKTSPTATARTPSSEGIAPDEVICGCECNGAMSRSTPMRLPCNGGTLYLLRRRRGAKAQEQTVVDQ